MSDLFIPTRAHGLAALARFLPSAGRAYAARRNYDLGPGRRGNVSLLSPYIRHRLITEAEVASAVLKVHGFDAAQKFIEEVCWRTYWKGWLEHRPGVWLDYLGSRGRDRTAIEKSGRTTELQRALQGDTGIDCFDAWVHELRDTGYLHNHARMWFASIWIFTLRLPWTLGADLFLRHLLDGDPASNTLSWRWVAGLQTAGKTYLARPDNIARYTEGRYPASGALARQLADAAPAPEPTGPLPPTIPLPDRLTRPPSGPLVLILTEDDLSPETWPVDPAHVQQILTLPPSTPDVAPNVHAFRTSALTDAGRRAATAFDCPVRPLVSLADAVAQVADNSPRATVVTMAPSVGPARDDIDRIAAQLAATGIAFVELARPWDAAFWPHAQRGFFPFAKRIPGILAALNRCSHGTEEP